VTIGNLNVDPGVSRVYGDVLLNGKTVVSSAYVFRPAGLLNDTFGTDAVTDELLVGVAKITVNTK
jgi:hypothetical protein